MGEGSWVPLDRKGSVLGSWRGGADAVQRPALELQRSGRRRSLVCPEDAPWVCERRRQDCSLRGSALIRE